MTVDLKQKSNMKKHNTVLLVIDMQNSVVASAYLRDEVIENIGSSDFLVPREGEVRACRNRIV